MLSENEPEQTFTQQSSCCYLSTHCAKFFQLLQLATFNDSPPPITSTPTLQTDNYEPFPVVVPHAQVVAIKGLEPLIEALPTLPLWLNLSDRTAAISSLPILHRF